MPRKYYFVQSGTKCQNVNIKLKLWILVRVWWRWMERNSWVYPTNKIRRWWIQNSSSQENGGTRTRSCYRSCPQFKKETFKSRIEGSHKLWIIDPSFEPWIHFPIKKPQLTFYHLRDDLCFYWVKITFWFWIFFYLVEIENNLKVVVMNRVVKLVAMSRNIYPLQFSVQFV